MSDHSRRITALTSKPNYQSWQALCELLDRLSPEEQAAAVEQAEAGMGGWPTELELWSGFTLAEGAELRRSPGRWAQEILRGEHQDKHRLIRIFESRGALRGGQEPLSLLDARLPAVAQVGFDQARLPSGFFKALHGAGPWERWQYLRLWTCDLKPAALKALARARLSDMALLNLSQNRFGPKGAAALQKAPAFTALRKVDLGLNGLGAEGAAALAGASWAAGLEALSLEHNGLNAADVAVVLGGCPRLSMLRLEGNPLPEAGDPGDWPAAELRALELDQVSVEGAWLARLLAAAPRLESLSLVKTGVGDAGAEAIADSGHAWRALDLSEAELSPAGMQAILRSPGVSGLRRLTLGQGADRAAAKLLIDGACPELEYLWWFGPGVSDEVGAMLRADPRLGPLLPY